MSDAAPRLAPRELRDFYRSIYRDSGLASRQIAAWRPSICPYEPIARWVPQGARVVDFGCGAGALLALLAESRSIAAGVGYDVSAGAIQAALGAQAHLSNNVLTFRQIGDFVEIPADQFDVVAMIDVLHHIPPARQQEAIAAAVARVHPGGRLIYKDMVSRPAWRRWGNTIHDLILARQLVNYVPVATVERWVTDTGATLLHGENYARLFYGHELRVFAR